MPIVLSNLSESLTSSNFPFKVNKSRDIIEPIPFDVRAAPTIHRMKFMLEEEDSRLLITHKIAFDADKNALIAAAVDNSSTIFPAMIAHAARKNDVFTIKIRIYIDRLWPQGGLLLAREYHQGPAKPQLYHTPDRPNQCQNQLCCRGWRGERISYRSCRCRRCISSSSP